MGRRARLAAWLAFAGAIVALDQIAKAAASRALDYGVPLPVLPGFNLTLLHNTGAAFSMFAEASGWQRWAFVVVAAAVSAWVVAMLRQAPATARWMPTALTLVLGGALGNCWDRVLLGYVVDYVQLCYQPYCFPAFNVADAAITLGAAMILLDALRSPADAQRGEGRV
jgi:signal peptidase II